MSPQPASSTPLEADIHVTRVSPRIGLNPEVAHPMAKGQITTYNDKVVDETGFEGMELYLAANDSPEASPRVWNLCKERRIPVNVANVPSERRFHFASIQRDGLLQVVTTNGWVP